MMSSVESRALLNEDLPWGLRRVIPVDIATDTTTQWHYYVAMLACDEDDELDASGPGPDGTR